MVFWHISKDIKDHIIWLIGNGYITSEAADMTSAIGPVSPVETDGRLGWYGGGGVAGWQGIDYTIQCVAVHSAVAHFKSFPKSPIFASISPN